jgi:hypothetical protein
VRRATPRRNSVAVAALTLVTFSLGATVAVLVAGSATAASPTTTKTPTSTTTTTESPAAHFFVINATVNAASDHVIVGSSAFPNFAKGAVDNYYSMAHSHVDNSPFAEGTASPFDTGPIGQTAAAGNTQQPQYADARWPGDSGKATYGSQGGPYAAAAASEYRATAEASEASNALSGPSAPSTMAVPGGFDDRLRQALAAWKAKWQGRLAPTKPTAPVPTPTVTIPSATVTTPIVTVTTPGTALGGLSTTPPANVPSPAVPPATLPSTGTSAPSPSRSLASASTTEDGLSLLTSSTLAGLDPKNGTSKTATAKTATTKTSTTKTATPKTGTPKTDTSTSATLVTSGESSVGRVSLGGGQIVIRGIHVSASIENDGTPTYKAAVSVAAASIGGVPVTIDQDGVHIAGQGQGLPYQQAGDALNGALKKAGIQLFVVAPEIKKGPCEQTDTGTGTGTTTTTTTSDQSDTTGMPNACDQTGTATACDQTGMGTSSGTTANAAPPLPTPTPTTSNDQSGTTATTSSCDYTDTTTTTSSCGETTTAAGTTTTSSDQAGTTTTTSSSDQPGMTTDPTSPGEMTVTATGVHVVFTQPVSQSGVPAQFAEHILGEVFLDSLAVPAGPVPDLDLSSSSSSSSCLGGGHSGGASTAGGSASAGGSTSSSSLSPSASTFGSTSQPNSSSTGNSLPAAFAAALRKPLWLLLAYVLWQALVIGTGLSLWNWRRGGAS